MIFRIFVSWSPSASKRPLPPKYAFEEMIQLKEDPNNVMGFPHLVSNPMDFSEKKVVYTLHDKKSENSGRLYISIWNQSNTSP